VDTVDVHDPMSQKPFLWNNNNPIAFRDPSGYATDAAAVINEGGGPSSGPIGGTGEGAGGEAERGAEPSEGPGAQYLRPGPFSGAGIRINSGTRPTAAQSRANNAQGDELGCHTCGVSVPGTRTGIWVLDHQPASSLNLPKGSEGLGFPQCTTCSATQGGFISGILRAAAKAAAAKPVLRNP
jgi:hypothetical protein